MYTLCLSACACALCIYRVLVRSSHACALCIYTVFLSSLHPHSPPPLNKSLTPNPKSLPLVYSIFLNHSPLVLFGLLLPRVSLIQRPNVARLTHTHTHTDTQPHTHTQRERERERETKRQRDDEREREKETHVHTRPDVETWQVFRRRMNLK